MNFSIDLALDWNHFRYDENIQIKKCEAQNKIDAFSVDLEQGRNMKMKVKEWKNGAENS